MKNAIRISVKKPCSEKFENFDETAKGGFCDTCEKEVIDFTNMPESELITYLCINKSNTCGRFKTSQLGTYQQKNMNNINMNFLSSGIAAMSFSLLSLCAISNLQAQDVAVVDSNPLIEISNTHILGKVATTIVDRYSVKGTVLDELNQPLPGVAVILKGTTDGVSTDNDGKFEFPKALEANDVLVFSYLGYESKEYLIPESESETIDITINFEDSNVILMGDVVIEGVYTSKRNIFQKIGGLFK